MGGLFVDGWLPLDRVLRNHLTDLLLAAFVDPAKRDALCWLSAYCELAPGQNSGVVSETALVRARPGSNPAALQVGVACLGGILQSRSGEPNVVAPGPRMVGRLASVGEVARIYLAVLQAAGRRQAALTAMEPLARAIAEAGFCFNAGLFFEAHEHLEHRWVTLPPGPVKRFMQGLIQISVGLYHARRGSYHGAVNQLTKGLEKLGGLRGTMMGLDCAQFVGDVVVYRRQLIARGSNDTGPLRPEEMPHMRLMGC